MSADFSETDAHTKNGRDTVQSLAPLDEVNFSGLPTRPLVDVAEKQNAKTRSHPMFNSRRASSVYYVTLRVVVCAMAPSFHAPNLKRLLIA